MSDRPKTLVVGLGNPILGDDGVGIQVVRALARLDDVPEEVTLEEACVGGLALAEMMSGYDRTVVIDAYRGPLLHVGAIACWSIGDLRKMGPVQPCASPHDASIGTAYDTLVAMGLPMPGDVLIVAIGADAVDTFSTDLTPEVKKAVPLVLDLVRTQLVENPV